MKSYQIVYYVFAIINSILVGSGLFYFIRTFLRIKKPTLLNTTKNPYVSHCFYAFAIINMTFLFLLGLSAYELFGINILGFHLLKITLIYEIIYIFLLGVIWSRPYKISSSIGSATGIGNMGIAPQIFILYPITGLMAIWLLKGIIRYTTT